MKAILRTAPVAYDALFLCARIDLSASAGRVMAPSKVPHVFHMPRYHEFIEPDSLLVDFRVCRRRDILFKGFRGCVLFYNICWKKLRTHRACKKRPNFVIHLRLDIHSEASIG